MRRSILLAALALVACGPETNPDAPNLAPDTAANFNQPIDARGAAFDPELHEAVAQRSAQDQPQGSVLEVVVPGYRFRGRVLRHAQVVVAGDREVAPTTARRAEESAL